MFSCRSRGYTFFTMVCMGLWTLPVLCSHAASAQLFVKPVSYVGTCPVRIKFSGIIHSDRTGRIQYRFIRSDNANTPVQTIHFSRPGEKKVHGSWTLGSEGLPEYDGWQLLEVTYPVKAVSNKARFSIRCRHGGGYDEKP